MHRFGAQNTNINQWVISGRELLDEDQVREKIGLESLLPDRLDGLKHSTFMNMVVNGYKNPYFEWEKSWGDGSGF